MGIIATANSIRGLLVYGVLLVTCCRAAGPLQAGVSVYRCTDSAGRVELRQTYCPSGDQQQLQVEIGNVGWVRSKSTAGSGQMTGAKRKTGRRTSKSEKSEAPPPDEARQHRCWKAKNNLERIQRQLRQGYRPAQGEKLRQRRREQEQYLQRFCQR